MEVNEIIAQLKNKFGDKVDIAQVTEKLKGMDLKNLSFADITSRLGLGNLLGDLDGDGVQESLIDELKGKLGSLFGKK